MKAKIGNTEIYFDVAGMQWEPNKEGFKERPVLFLLHGGPGGDHQRYKLHSLELQDAAQLIFIDNRGCGRSKKTKAADYTLKNNIEDIEKLRKYLGLDSICILGTSYGGVVAQGYAIRYPKHLDKLILVATSPSYQFLESAKSNLQTRGNKRQIAMAEHLWQGTFKNPAHAEKFFKLMDPLYSTQKKKKSTSVKSKTIWSHEALNKGFSEILRTFNFEKQLRKIKCPTLILGGKKDWICDPEQSIKLHQHIRNSELHIFNNCGHSISVDAHKKYIKLIKKFLMSK